MTEIKGIHPYADEFPLASDEELAELAESIATVGLENPVVLTPDGLVLDGRNRLKACEIAGVEPHFKTREGDDDDYKEFVIGINTTGRRESMTPQMAAASVALILGHERRKNGQWDNPGGRGHKRETTVSGLDDAGGRKALARAGIVLDVLGPSHLAEVRDGDATLNAKYELARAEKERQENAERIRFERIQQAEEAERVATEKFQTVPEAADWLAGKPEGVFDNMRGAWKAYLEYDDKAKADEEAQRREVERKEKELRDGDQREANRLRNFVDAYGTASELRNNPRRKEILAVLGDSHKNDFLAIEKELWA